MIKVTNIHKRFGSLEVLKGISLEVKQGELISIVGASGAGKTTLLQIMGTLSRADEGEIEIDGQKITMTLKQWSDALNGATVTVDGVDYNFGDGQADVDTRLNILAAIESSILSTYNYIPMLQDGSMSLLSQQVFYVVEDYNPVMGRGGITYMKYNYDDAEWADYVKSQGSQLKY